MRAGSRYRLDFVLVVSARAWYSNLTGFTRIADAHGPEATLSLLNEYAEAQVEEIEAQGGHVLKFIGDRIRAGRGRRARAPREPRPLRAEGRVAAAGDVHARPRALAVRRQSHRVIPRREVDEGSAACNSLIQRESGSLVPLGMTPDCGCNREFDQLFSLRSG
ncbi:MAG: hypothetical protein IT518_06005 [Burkholderiales bacterium]|nr:hypothetical protein [Burkholderiales bacterium]